MPADQTRLNAAVAFLTNLHPARSCYNLAALNQATDYIKGYFQKRHGTVSEQGFTADGRQYRNTSCSFGPPTAGRIIVGAHYNVCGDQPGLQNFPNEALARMYPNTGNFIIVVGKSGQEEFTRHVQQLMPPHAGSLDEQRINLPESLGLAGLSDHRNYWRYGYDAVMINDTSFLRNPHYPQKTDTIDTLDFSRMARVVDGVFGALLGL